MIYKRTIYIYIYIHTYIFLDHITCWNFILLFSNINTEFLNENFILKFNSFIASFKWKSLELCLTKAFLVPLTRLLEIYFWHKTSRSLVFPFLLSLWISHIHTWFLRIDLEKNFESLKSKLKYDFLNIWKQYFKLVITNMFKH